MTLSFSTWNCADGFARKLPWLHDISADIITVQELRQTAFQQAAPNFRHAFFQASNTARGLAAFSNLEIPITPLPLRLRKSDQCYLAVSLVMPFGPVDVLCAWVKPVEDYVRPSQRAFRAFFRASKAPFRFILGDLNQNKVFDQRRRLGLFADTEKLMTRHNLVSAYHTATDEAFGAEKQPTHFLTYAKTRPYHLDYIFAPEELVLAEFELLPLDPWFSERRSDHLPMRALYQMPYS